ncbi:cytochrome c-type biogenesis protein [Agarivorans sp. 1_MG-2023]|uniref:cytochrome c-type biogenesis protein n=1 Tax=Agarivorans sp. 1_MG-2023 TaxID=3062634 RepID=UPI0026E28E71|nr:cytochrome c-type biogenesis protein [Agarivorans sp. 1_MG-2023]MDO6764775.1 cytochrome c-type biogenesis protein CcmH [Agarivorans sp. 1_MG-2023]
MNKHLRSILVALCFCAPIVANAAIEAHEFDSPEQEELFRELTRELRCPKCQNNNISDSNAGLAQDLREKTYQMVKSGSDKQQVLDYMVARYGNFVRYDPPLTPAVLTLWLAPIGIIFIGGFTVWRLARRKKCAQPELDSQEQQRLAELLKQTEQKK